MSLNLVNDIFNNLKESKFVQNFINELSNSLQSVFKDKDRKIPLIEGILSTYNLTTGNKNAIRMKEDETLIKYWEQNNYNEPMYFVKDDKKRYWLNNCEYYNNDVYTVLKIYNSEIEDLEISKKDISSNIDINDVLRIENGNYVVDNIATTELQEQLLDIATEIINNQNTNLSQYRKDGHLYLVTEELGNNRFLSDLTEPSNFEFEEVDIPKDLLNMAKQGSVLKYINGNYEFYSNNGFEIVE